MSEELNKDILDYIGKTPLVKIKKIVSPDMADIYAKCEQFNPGGSVKDRVCLSMIERAESEGLLTKDSTVIEPTSGNTGIGLAIICAVKGYKCILTMPESMSLERIYILKSYGAEVVLTANSEGMIGSIKKAEALAKKIKNSFIPQQFCNLANPEVHRLTTAKELLLSLEGHLDAFVAGVGTGGTITGVGEELKKALPTVKIFAVEPQKSPVLSGGQPGPHMLQGIGAGFVPDILNRDIIDDVLQVDDEDAFHMMRKLGSEEGLLVGISAGAAMHAAMRIAEDLGPGKRVATILCDTGERYFSIAQYFEA